MILGKVRKSSVLVRFDNFTVYYSSHLAVKFAAYLNLAVSFKIVTE